MTERASSAPPRKMDSRDESDIHLTDVHGPESGQVSVTWIVVALLRQRWFLLICTAVGMALALTVALTRRPTYTTTFSFVPQAASDASRTGLASLAGQLGVSLGGSGQGQSPQFYADLLGTRELLAPVASDSFSLTGPTGRRVPLSEILGLSGGPPALVLDGTQRILRGRVISSTVAARTTFVVTVQVKTASPAVSYGIAQKLVEGLNRFNLLTRQSQAGAERKFIEGRLSVARAALRSSEDALQRFLQANRQFANSPELMLQRTRMEREIGTQQQLVTGLVQQFEDARIREVRDTPVITVIEQPVVAVRADPRRRFTTLVSGMFVAFLIASSIVLVRALIARRREEHDPDFAALVDEWRRMRGARP